MRASKGPRHGLGLVALLMVLVLTACGGNTTDGGSDQSLPESVRKGTDEIVLLSRQDPGTWDMTQTGTTIQWRWLPRNVLETLVLFDAEGEPHPSLAESWEISEDRTQYTFHLRQDVTFHNGVAFDAEQAANSLKAYWNSPTAMRSAPLQAISAVDVIDTYTMQVQLSQPSLLFWREMGGVGGTVFEMGSADGMSAKPVGTGPYEFAEYVAGDHVTLQAYDGYWGEAPAISTAQIRFIDDIGASFNALLSAEVDVAPYVPQTMFARIKSEGYDQLYNLSVDGAGGQLSYAAMNSREAPFDNLEFRQAVAHALKRSDLSAAVGAEWAAFPSCTFATPEKPYFSDTECELEYDVDRSAELAAQSGVAEPFSFTYLSDSAIGDVVGSQLQAAGFEITSEPMDFARYSQVVLAGSPPQFQFTEINTPRDIWQFVCPSAESMNWHSYCDEATTAKLREADRAATFAEQEQLLAEADRMIQQQAIVVTLLSTSSVTLVRPDIEGWEAPLIQTEVNLSALSWAS